MGKLFVSGDAKLLNALKIFRNSMIQLGVALSGWYQFSSLLFGQHKQFCLKVLRRWMHMLNCRGDLSCSSLGFLKYNLSARGDNGCWESVGYSWGKKHSTFSHFVTGLFFFKTVSWQKFLKKSSLLHIRVLPSFLSTGVGICISIYPKSTQILWNHL